MRLGTWRTRNISIGGTNIVEINFANIGNQVKFIVTLKYYQQSLSALATTMTDQEKQFSKCYFEDQQWILNYLSSCKGIIHYEMITRFDSLDISPPEDFFLRYHFYLSLKNTTVSKEGYNALKKLHLSMKLENLG